MAKQFIASHLAQTADCCMYVLLCRVGQLNQVYLNLQFVPQLIFSCLVLESFHEKSSFTTSLPLEMYLGHSMSNQPIFTKFQKFVPEVA